MSLREQVEALYAKGGGFTPSDRGVFESFKQALNRGEVRAAERDAGGTWRVNAWVKQGILAGFRMGALADMSAHASLRFFDKDTYPVRATSAADNVRIVPGGSSVMSLISLTTKCLTSPRTVSSGWAGPPRSRASRTGSTRRWGS